MLVIIKIIRLSGRQKANDHRGGNNKWQKKVKDIIILQKKLTN